MSELLYRWIRESDRPKGQEDVTHVEAGWFRKVSWCKTHDAPEEVEDAGYCCRNLDVDGGPPPSWSKHPCVMVELWMEVV